MIPVILGAIGGYLIGTSTKEYFDKGGETYKDFGYDVINDEVTLKDGKKVFITKGRYYWSNELGDNRPEGIYYLTKEGDFIPVKDIKFKKGGKVSNSIHEEAKKLLGDIQLANQKTKKLVQKNIDQLYDNFDNNPDYEKVIKIFNDYGANDKGKTIKLESIERVSEKLEEEL